ncbi:S8 family serine peptidase [Brumimicrobium aurantiacum]|uniref:Peptidase S8 n=1 Tax=Brumimicrobium aurantiacum TaxID=1737063 RepID=A0A3E1EVC5_9FLAO|nr:S8 family serine peptidase [Brumimicrobium aurantiacum]RFC53516.1 peptidase S8 [Brumimicrobium aurantiacum]
MRKIFLRIMLPALIGAYFSTASAQVDKKVLNWYNSSKTGMSTDKAYKKLKKITPDTVVVAIIDSGIDIEHEDLQGKIWVNKDEIPGNGIDDDNNGYIDDVNGWNFLGNKEGENINTARLNVTRIYAELKPRFEGVDSADVKAEDSEDYALYLETKGEVEKNRERYKAIIEQTTQFKDQMLPNLPDMIKNMMDVEEYDEKSLKKWKAEGPQQEQMKQIGLSLLSGELNEEVLEEQIEQLQGMIDGHYNPDLNERALIGDDIYDITDTDYGNNDVEGPDALHGTHVGGIVAATRGNDLGGDGVADNVLLMSLRAVPDGDEFDKDIALAIRYAVDNGAKVINGSFGKSYSSLPKAVYDAIIYAQENDVLFVHAAGNSAEDLAIYSNFPAVKYDFQELPFTHLLTIGASTRNHEEKLAAGFSNYGKDQVDIFAPGYEIYNTFPDNEYEAINGTSMASPMVAGVAALLKGYFPSLSMEEVRQIILDSGDYFGDTYQYVPGTKELVKFDNLSRYGKVVNVKAAVLLAKERTESK